MLSTFTCSQNGSAELQRRFHIKFIRESKPRQFFCDFLKAQLENLKLELAIFSSNNPFPSSPSEPEDDRKVFQYSNMVFRNKPRPFILCGFPLMRRHAFSFLKRCYISVTVPFKILLEIPNTPTCYVLQQYPFTGAYTRMGNINNKKTIF